MERVDRTLARRTRPSDMAVGKREGTVWMGHASFHLARAGWKDQGCSPDPSTPDFQRHHCIGDERDVCSPRSASGLVG